MGTRKNQSRLTAAEKERFIGALKEVKASGVYDRYVEVHRKAMMEKRPDPAHGGPAFLPWHREYLRRFELELQKVDSRVTIPYWNWLVDRSPDAAPFTVDFMGGNGRRRDGKVVDGPFAHSTGEWDLNVRVGSGMPRFLTRFIMPGFGLPNRRQVTRALRRTRYDVKPWNFRSDPRKSFRESLERPHNAVHGWVGGEMVTATSPNDPIFFLHHAMVDRLWAIWQRRHPEERYRPFRGGPSGHNMRDPMWPWRREKNPPTPKSVLDHNALGYRYAGENKW